MRIDEEKVKKMELALELVLDDYKTRINDHDCVIVNPVLRTSRIKMMKEALGRGDK